VRACVPGMFHFITMIMIVIANRTLLENARVPNARDFLHSRIESKSVSRHYVIASLRNARSYKRRPDQVGSQCR